MLGSAHNWEHAGTFIYMIHREACLNACNPCCIGCVCSIPGPDLGQEADVKHASEAIGARADEQSDQQRGVEQRAEMGRRCAQGAFTGRAGL